MRLDLEAHYKDKTGLIEEILLDNYGPDSHTDNLIYKSSNKLVRYVEEYLNVINKRETKTGFSISIDEKSFKKWWNKYNI